MAVAGNDHQFARGPGSLERSRPRQSRGRDVPYRPAEEHEADIEDARIESLERTAFRRRAWREGRMVGETRHRQPGGPIQSIRTEGDECLDEWEKPPRRRGRAMTGQQKDALMDQRAAAMGDDTGRYSEVVRLGEIDERPDIRKEIQDVDDLHRGQAVGDASTRVGASSARSPGVVTNSIASDAAPSMAVTRLVKNRTRMVASFVN